MKKVAESDLAAGRTEDKDEEIGSFSIRRTYSFRTFRVAELTRCLTLIASLKWGLAEA